jgi:hypothetical protein
LIDIADGVASARQPVAKLGGAVNPENDLGEHGSNSPVHQVEFDVAVFAEQSVGGELGASVSVMSIVSVSASGETEVTRNQTQTRLKFSVPMKLPTGRDTDRPGRGGSINQSYDPYGGE